MGRPSRSRSETARRQAGLGFQPAGDVPAPARLTTSSAPPRACDFDPRDLGGRIRWPGLAPPTPSSEEHLSMTTHRVARGNPAQATVVPGRTL